MSNLQARSKPILLKLMGGRNVSLSTTERVTISRWAAMTFTNLAYADNQPSTEKYQRSVLLKGDMPPGWYLGIGILSDCEFAGLYERYSHAMSLPFDGKPFTLLACGWLIVENVAFGHMHTVSDLELHYSRYFTGTTPADYLDMGGLNVLWPTGENEFSTKLEPTSVDQLLTLRIPETGY